MNILKLFVFIFFGLIGVVLFSLLSAVGGLVGGGLGWLIAMVWGSSLPGSESTAWVGGSLAGGVLAALAFHGVIKGIDYFHRFVAQEESETGLPEQAPPQLSRGGKHLWGSLSYFLSTVIAVNAFHALTSNGAINLAATILASGFLGLVGLALVIHLKLWEPSFKSE
ncbi:MAG: hypothetical protein IT342_21835 [Candidatus Melainabacteria bacterium]|nr:hypothetical protein [Candidatus Melainabacteria bacterium]